MGRGAGQPGGVRHRVVESQLGRSPARERRDPVCLYRDHRPVRRVGGHSGYQARTIRHPWYDPLPNFRLHAPLVPDRSPGEGLSAYSHRPTRTHSGRGLPRRQLFGRGGETSTNGRCHHRDLHRDPRGRGPGQAAARDVRLGLSRDRHPRRCHRDSPRRACPGLPRRHRLRQIR